MIVKYIISLSKQKDSNNYVKSDFASHTGISSSIIESIKRIGKKLGSSHHMVFVSNFDFHLNTEDSFDELQPTKYAKIVVIAHR